MNTEPSKAAIETVMIAAGGTGGHVFPAMAVCEELVESGVPIIWVGTKKGIESRIVPAKGIPLAFIDVQGFRGKSLLQKIKVPFDLSRSLFVVGQLIAEHRVAVVLGLGGYVSAAVGIAALVKRKPLIIQEQNAVAGSSNRLLSRFAKKIFCGFPGVFEERGNAIFSGNPVRKSIVAAAKKKSSMQDCDQQNAMQCRILVIGGSLGARPINQTLPAALAVLCNEMNTQAQSHDRHFDISVRHQTGRGHLENTQARYQEQSALSSNVIDVETVEFIDDMDDALSSCDLVIARAGALSISELLIMGLPSILIPLPHAIDDHQALNAQYVADRGAAKLLPQSEMNANSLSELLIELLMEPARLKDMSVVASALAKPSAAAVIADTCREYCHG